MGEPELLCSICHKAPARPHLRTCRPCVEKNNANRDRRLAKERTLTASIRSSEQLATILATHGFTITAVVEENISEDEEALVEVAPNIVIQIAWRRALIPQFTYNGGLTLTFAVTTNEPTRATRHSRRIPRDASIGIAGDGHVYGITLESRPSHPRPTALHIGYYDSIATLIAELHRLTKPNRRDGAHTTRNQLPQNRTTHS